MSVERYQRAILLRALFGLRLPAGSRHSFGVECLGGRTATVAAVRIVQVRLIKAAHDGENEDLNPGEAATRNRVSVRSEGGYSDWNARS